MLKTKRGEPVPGDLAAALSSDPEMLTKWDALRPSCQREHVAAVEDAKKPETRARRIAAVLRMTAAWYERHRGTSEPRA